MLCECVRSIINFQPRGKDNKSIHHYCDTQCIAVLYSDWSLQMGQMGPKMTLSTLTMIGDDFLRRLGGPQGLK